MKRSYDDERYLPWYRRPTPTWLELSVAARGVLVSVAMELNDATGAMALRRGLSSLSTLLRIPWADLEPALTELLKVGKLAWDTETQTLSDPEYGDRRRPTSKERMRKKRERDASDVTSVTNVTGPPCDASDVTSSLLSVPISSGSGSQIASPPAWWQGTLDTVEANMGVRLAPGEAWLRYAGHRASKEPPKPTSPPDALHWLGTVMVAEARKARDEAHHREKRDKDFDAKRRFAKDGPEKPPAPSKAQAEQFAAELAARVRAQRAAGGT